MKPALFLFLVIGMPTFAQKPTAVADSTGACSPNIISNQGQVQFTCNAPLDADTARKIVSLLNQILKKENSATDPSAGTNQKLDQILTFLQNQAQQVQALQQQAYQRHLTDDQKAKLIQLLKADAPQEFYFISAPDPETTYFSNEILAALDSAGWKAVPHPPNWPVFEKPGQGIIVWVDGYVAEDKDVPRGAVALLQALKAIGFEPAPGKFIMMPKGKFGIYVGIKLAAPAP